MTDARTESNGRGRKGEAARRIMAELGEGGVQNYATPCTPRAGGP
jgi:hypothetical protein